jgi:hypothetical protein
MVGPLCITHLVYIAKLQFFPKEEGTKLPWKTISLKEQIMTCLTRKYKNKLCPKLSSQGEGNFIPRLPKRRLFKKFNF